MSTKQVELLPENGTEVLIPLNKLKKSRKNARKTPHSEAAIEADAAIAARGILQNLVVEPELDGEGAAAKFYFVTVGEGRRLAQLLRVKQKLRLRLSATSPRPNDVYAETLRMFVPMDASGPDILGTLLEGHPTSRMLALGSRVT